MLTWRTSLFCIAQLGNVSRFSTLEKPLHQSVINLLFCDIFSLICISSLLLWFIKSQCSGVIVLFQTMKLLKNSAQANKSAGETAWGESVIVFNPKKILFTVGLGDKNPSSEICSVEKSMINNKQGRLKPFLYFNYRQLNCHQHSNHSRKSPAPAE